MLNLNYYIHVLLQSKYKIFINLFLLIIIYSLLYSQQFIHCMNEGDLLPDVAEAKPAIRRRTNLSHFEQSIIQNIDSFIGDKLFIQEQKNEIARLTHELEFQKELHNTLSEMDTYFEIINEFGYEDQHGIDEICKKYNKSYKDVNPWAPEEGKNI